MPLRRALLSGLALLAAALPAAAASLQPHEAVYELVLDQPASGFNGAEGRIALQLRNEDCDWRSLDYRFVVRFQQESELTVTDQHTLSRETRGGDRFEFETTTSIDGTPQETVKGKAGTRNDTTRIDYERPVERVSEIASAAFPMGHTARIIEEAKAGRRIFEARLFDGDGEAEKGLTTTSVIAPVPGDQPPAPRAEGREAEGAASLAGVRSWRISESYYNSDSNTDGMPIFETRYRLYENGVSDELTMDFGTYVLKGSLSRLQMLENGCAGE